MLKRYAELIGKNSSNPATLMDNDILGDYPNKDQTSDLYNMVIHADSVCSARGSHPPPPLSLFFVRQQESSRPSTITHSLERVAPFLSPESIS